MPYYQTEILGANTGLQAARALREDVPDTTSHRVQEYKRSRGSMLSVQAATKTAVVEHPEWVDQEFRVLPVVGMISLAPDCGCISCRMKRGEAFTLTPRR